VRVLVIVAAGTIMIGLGVGAWLFLMRAPAPAPPAAQPAGAGASNSAERAPAPATPGREPEKRPAPKAATAPEPAAPVEAAPTTGTLRIETDVADASVLLDRVGVGTAPITIPDVAPGPHRLNVSATGYDGYSETIDVQPGTHTISIAFKEVKLDVRIDVVHQHGIGSCRGVLSATPQGLRYEAADGKDSFSVPLTDFETFEVDYLAKNLRLRTKGGKTYNFGDPDGKADRLFTFHREVDKARKRIISGR
jgi:PEGA domain